MIDKHAHRIVRTWVINDELLYRQAKDAASRAEGNRQTMVAYLEEIIDDFMKFECGFEDNEYFQGLSEDLITLAIQSASLDLIADEFMRGDV